MMAFKFIAIFAFVATCSAGVLDYHHGYSDAPSVSYSSISSPVAAHESPSYDAPAYKLAVPISYAAPVHKAVYSDAPSVSYSSISSPEATHGSLSYAAPAYKLAVPVSYAAPVHKAVYSDAPSVSYSSILSPEATHGYPSYDAQAYKSAVPVSYAAPVQSEPTALAHYDFSYGVEDHHTGDIKSHQESRKGDVTKGSYSLIEADGSKRIVEYTVDAHSGFNAVVHKEAAQGHVKVAAPLVAKVDYAVPAVKVAAPLAYVKVPAFNKISYSSAPEVSYSSASGFNDQSYYH